MKNLLFGILFLSFSLAYAQIDIDCSGDREIKGITHGQTFTAPCDTILVMNAPTYKRMAVERRQLEAQIEVMRQANNLLEDMQHTQDSLLLVYQDQIQSFENYYQTTDQSLQELQLNLEKSMANTEEAVKIAKRNKVLGILVGGAAGLAGGLLIGGIAF